MAADFPGGENRELEKKPEAKQTTKDNIKHYRHGAICEAHVNDAIRENFNVKKVNSSHTKNQTEIISEEPLDEAKLKDVIAETGYELQGIQQRAPCEEGLLLREIGVGLARCLGGALHPARRARGALLFKPGAFAALPCKSWRAFTE